MRPPLSVTGTRWTRWTPLSNFSSREHARARDRGDRFLEAADFRLRSPRSSRSASPWPRHSAGTCAADRRRTAPPRRRRCRRGFRASPGARRRRRAAAASAPARARPRRSCGLVLGQLLGGHLRAIPRRPRAVICSSDGGLVAQPPHLARRRGDRLDLGIILGQPHERVGREIAAPTSPAATPPRRASMAAIRSAEMLVMPTLDASPRVRMSRAVKNCSRLSRCCTELRQIALTRSRNSRAAPSARWIDRRRTRRRRASLRALSYVASHCPRKAISADNAAASQLGDDRRPSLAARVVSIGNDDDLERVGRRRLDHHRQPLDPRRPADRRRVRAAEAFDQAVIAAAGDAPRPARRAGR